MDMLKLFVTMIIVQGFYAFAVTLIAYSVPPDVLGYTSTVSQPASDFNIPMMNSKVSSNLNLQKNIPLIDLGSLLFYSGNFIMDMLLNFITAIPQMISLLIMLIFGNLINLDPYILTQINVFSGGIITLIYMIGIIQTLMSIRSRGSTIT
jgi:hypothetical protein